MYKWIIAILMVLMGASAQADMKYQLDQNFCTARALANKSTAEARDRGVDQRTQRLELIYMKSVSKEGTLFHSGVEQAVYDVEYVYTVGRKSTPTSIYTAMYKSCMEAAYLASN